MTTTTRTRSATVMTTTAAATRSPTSARAVLLIWTVVSFVCCQKNAHGWTTGPRPVVGGGGGGRVGGSLWRGDLSSRRRQQPRHRRGVTSIIPLYSNRKDDDESSDEQHRQSHPSPHPPHSKAAPSPHRSSSSSQSSSSNQKQQQQQQHNSASTTEDHHHHHHHPRRMHNDNNNQTTASTNGGEMEQNNTTDAVLKKIRVSKARAEIDQMLAGPDAPVDLERELQRVVSMAPSVNDMVDDAVDVVQAETDLYNAVKRQDYETAAIAQQQLGAKHVDDCGAVLQANAAFYRAFSKRNYDQMQAIWCQDNTITCLHPGSKTPLVGTKQVSESWQKLLKPQAAGTAFQSTWMEPHNIRLSVKGSTWAIVLCEELVYVRRFRRGKRKETRLVNKLWATNIFRKVPHSELDGENQGNRWKLTHHHASWHATSEAGKAAMLSVQGPSTSSSSSSSSAEDDSESIGMDGILGLRSLQADLGGAGQKGQKNNASSKAGVKKSLADLLSGNLNDVFKPPSGGANGDAENPMIIRFQRIEGDEEDDLNEMEYLDLDDEDFEDDDEDDDDDDDDDDEDDELSTRIQVVTPSSGSNKGTRNTNKSTSRKVMSMEEEEERMNSQNKDVLRQSCISMLRKLTNDGILSPRQKRVLLTDIIYCSANGEFSMVEVAYELLCTEGDGDDSNIAEEEFAEQCRVFATSLAKSANEGHPASDAAFD